ncbi:hypothetical protein KXW50_009116, partial [Aspergillus fumigatus]
YPGGTVPAVEGDTSALIERLTKLPLAHQPGSAFEYGFSIDVLGAVVEKVSEQRLGEYLARNVWQPLGMTDATFKPSEAQRARLARPFANDPLNGKPQSIPLLDTPSTFDCGGACAFATVADYLRFGQMLLNGGEFEGRRYLSPAAFKDMTTDHVGPGSGVGRDYFYFPGDGFGYGYGLAVRTDPGNARPPPPGSLGELKWDSGSGTYFG